ncbi:glycine zipper domain-containing protein [Candidatus Velamenicoccus archaeovorus]|nr:glycine zipper domain-containing protein [Candidatus Velamenicoccus archaeovorus]
MQILKMVMSGVMAVALVLPLAGCDTMGENTKTGALGGALVGSVAGGVIGHQSGHGVEGALIGGTVGALGGGLIGHSIDQKRTKEQIMSGKEKLGISDVIVLAKSGMTDDAIIAKIAETGSVYNLSVEEITTLQKEGVSNRVINYMMTTAKK